MDNYVEKVIKQPRYGALFVVNWRLYLEAGVPRGELYNWKVVFQDGGVERDITPCLVAGTQSYFKTEAENLIAAEIEKLKQKD